MQSLSPQDEGIPEKHNICWIHSTISSDFRMLKHKTEPHHCEGDNQLWVLLLLTVACGGPGSHKMWWKGCQDVKEVIIKWQYNLKDQLKCFICMQACCLIHIHHSIYMIHDSFSTFFCVVCSFDTESWTYLSLHWHDSHPQTPNPGSWFIVKWFIADQKRGTKVRWTKLPGNIAPCLHFSHETACVDSWRAWLPSNVGSILGVDRGLHCLLRSSLVSLNTLLSMHLKSSKTLYSMRKLENSCLTFDHFDWNIPFSQAVIRVTCCWLMISHSTFLRVIHPQKHPVCVTSSYQDLSSINHFHKTTW